LQAGKQTDIGVRQQHGEQSVGFWSDFLSSMLTCNELLFFRARPSSDCSIVISTMAALAVS
ncbi:MAG: hypothetical protein ACK56I_05715, partial [bacterium]